jgi:hypothetical protein
LHFSLSALWPFSADDNDVDIYDLSLFSDDWLWVAPCSQFYQSFAGQPEAGSSFMMTDNSTELTSLTEEAPVETINPATMEGSDLTVAEPVNIEELVNWLDGIWQAGEITISEEEYLEFRDKILHPPE